MALRLGAPIIVDMNYHGDLVTAHFLDYSHSEMKAALDKLIHQRVKIDEETGLPVDARTGAREAFFDSACTKVVGFEDEKEAGSDEWVDIMEFDDWQDRVPADFKQSFASSFEEKRTLSRQERKNSKGQSKPPSSSERETGPIAP